MIYEIWIYYYSLIFIGLENKYIENIYSKEYTDVRNLILCCDTQLFIVLETTKTLNNNNSNYIRLYFSFLNLVNPL